MGNFVGNFALMGNSVRGEFRFVGNFVGNSGSCEMNSFFCVGILVVNLCWVFLRGNFGSKFVAGFLDGVFLRGNSCTLGDFWPGNYLME